MNFRDNYKKANDRIAGDSELLEKILNTPCKEKTKIIPFVYKAASCAAAIVLIAVVAFTSGIKEKVNIEEESVIMTRNNTLMLLSEDEGKAVETTEESAVYDMRKGGRAIEKESYSASEILSCIGMNYESFLLAGMTAEEDAFAEYSDEGELLSYEINLALDGGEKKLNIRITDSETPLSYEITNEGGFITVQKTLGSTDIFASAQNISEDEVKNYIDNLN